MAKTLADYLLLVEREFEYKIKIAKDVTEDQFFLIENLLQKYDLVEVKNIVRQPIQNSADFPNIQPTEIYVVDIVTRLPLSPTAFIEVLARSLKIPLQLLIVRGKNDPLEKLEGETEEKVDGPIAGDDLAEDAVEKILDVQGRDKKPSLFKSKLDEVTGTMKVIDNA